MCTILVTVCFVFGKHCFFMKLKKLLWNCTKIIFHNVHLRWKIERWHFIKHPTVKVFACIQYACVYITMLLIIWLVFYKNLSCLFLRTRQTRVFRRFKKTKSMCVPGVLFCTLNKRFVQSIQRFSPCFPRSTSDSLARIETRNLICWESDDESKRMTTTS